MFSQFPFWLISTLRYRGADPYQSTDQKPAFDSLRQIFGRAPAPIMEEHYPRLFMGHVLMYGDNVDLFLEQRFQNRLQFIFRDREISVGDCVVVAAGERGPRVYAHVFVDLDAMHCCRSAERELYHSIF